MGHTGWPSGDCLSATFSNVDLIWLGVRCDPDVAVSREARRLDRVERMARKQSVSVHAGVVYDVEVDTMHSNGRVRTRHRAPTLA